MINQSNMWADCILFVVSAALFLIAIVTFLVPLVLYNKKKNRCSISVESKVVSNQYRQRVKRASGTSSKSLFAPVFEYSHNGVKYRSAAGIATQKTYEPGIIVNIMINPDSPKEILSEHDITGYIKIAFCGIFPLCFSIGIFLLGILSM